MAFYNAMQQDLPPVEYEHRLALRRDDAKALIGQAGFWWFVGQLASLILSTFAVVIAALAQVGAPRGPILWLFVLPVAAWGGSVIAAGFGAIVTIRDWTLLPSRQRSFGLLPWLILLAEVSPLLMKFVF